MEAAVSCTGFPGCPFLPVNPGAPGGPAGPYIAFIYYASQNLKNCKLSHDSPLFLVHQLSLVPPLLPEDLGDQVVQHCPKVWKEH
jgi:hypothetical protein